MMVVRHGDASAGFSLFFARSFSCCDTSLFSISLTGARLVFMETMVYCPVMSEYLTLTETQALMSSRES